MAIFVKLLYLTIRQHAANMRLWKLKNGEANAKTWIVTHIATLAAIVHGHLEQLLVGYLVDWPQRPCGHSPSNNLHGGGVTTRNIDQRGTTPIASPFHKPCQGFHSSGCLCLVSSLFPEIRGMSWFVCAQECSRGSLRDLQYSSQSHFRA